MLKEFKSKYFSFSELTHTDTEIPNMPTENWQIDNLIKLAEFLDNVREDYGDAICVNSAYRSHDVNRAVDGCVNSCHLQGIAADIRPSYIPSQDYYERFQQLIDVFKDKKQFLKEFVIYKNFIHIAIKL